MALFPVCASVNSGIHLKKGTSQKKIFSDDDVASGPCASTASPENVTYFGSKTASSRYDWVRIITGEWLGLKMTTFV